MVQSIWHSTRSHHEAHQVQPMSLHRCHHDWSFLVIWTSVDPKYVDGARRLTRFYILAAYKTNLSWLSANLRPSKLKYTVELTWTAEFPSVQSAKSGDDISTRSINEYSANTRYAASIFLMKHNPTKEQLTHHPNPSILGSVVIFLVLLGAALASAYTSPTAMHAVNTHFILIGELEQGRSKLTRHGKRPTEGK